MKLSPRVLLIPTLFLSLAAISSDAQADEMDAGVSAAQSAVRNERDVISLQERQERKQPHVAAPARVEKAAETPHQGHKSAPAADTASSK